MRIVTGLLLGLVAALHGGHASAAPEERDGALLAKGDVPKGPPPPRARPITAAATVATPVCLGFIPGTALGHVLTTNYDPGIPEWYVQVTRGHAGSGGELTMMVKTRDRAVAKRRFAALVKPINALIRTEKLVACTSTRVGRDQAVEVTISGRRTAISYQQGQLVVAPEGKPRDVRPQTEIVNLSMVAVFTATNLPGLAVVLRDHIGGGQIADRVEWFTVE